MHLDRFWHLLSKHLAGEASVEEIAELEALMKAHPDLSYPAQHLIDLWKLPPSTDTEGAADAYKQLLARMQKPHLPESVFEPQSVKEKAPRRRIALVLGSLATMGVVLSLLLLNTKKTPAATTTTPTPKIAEVKTAAGKRTKLLLPDSSVVWLNAGSRLTYEEGFGKAHRKASLNGEAFFEVRKSAVPFLLQAHGVQVRVLGTAFNVKSYPNEDRTETTLIHGRVEIMVDKRPGEKFVLKPNEKLSVSDRAVAGKPAPVAQQPVFEWSQATRTPTKAVVETAWVENKLIFQDESLADVARKMERWYNVEISITDPALAALRVGGGPFENETITQALEALQIAFDFRFRVRGNQIIITR